MHQVQQEQREELVGRDDGDGARLCGADAAEGDEDVRRRLEDTFAAASFGPGGTHLGAIPGLRIDGILADTTLQCVSHHTHGVVMSDHRPVTAVLQAQK